MPLFKAKSPAAPAPVSLSLTVVDDVPLQRKLESEARTCPTCSYRISNPMNDRCPRCFTTVPLSEHTNCGECSHQGNCAYRIEGMGE